MTADAIWIGGAAGAGKTTVARRLMRRWGLRIYSSDNWTWVHRDRAIAAGVEAAIAFERSSPVDRANATPEVRRAMWLGDERAPMVLDDVGSLPPGPLVVAEGGVISPEIVDPARAVWLVPARDFQLRHRLPEWVAIGHSAEAARERGITLITIDGTRTITEVVEEVERVLREPLTAGPHAQSIDERRAFLREANLAAVKQVRDGCARPWSTAESEGQIRSFVCECGDRDCEIDPDVSVGVAADAPVVAATHRPTDEG